MNKDIARGLAMTARMTLTGLILLLTGGHADAQVTVNGSVFGGGNEADVMINTEVNISAGTVEGNVYGGGNLGDVGTISDKSDKANYTWTDQEGNANTSANEGNKNTGVCKVNITGGLIGLAGNTSSDKYHGNVFGGGKGDENSGFYCEKGMVYSTSVEITAGTVKGTVFGGGEVGRVEDNTIVTIGVAGASGDTSTPIISGDVFGAGKGLKTHGYSALVRGNPVVTVQGKTLVGGSVFGGGEIASVGKHKVKTGNNTPEDAPADLPIGMPYTLANTNLGKCTVKIKDNVTITNNVYGAGQGVDDYTYSDSFKHMGITGWDDPFADAAAYHVYLQTLALTTDTHVSLEGSAHVNGSVFGGSESGFVQYDTNVTIKGGVIGTDVYGGGRGLTNNIIAGRVNGNTNVHILGGTITRNVYGGAALARSNTESTSTTSGGDNPTTTTTYPTATVNLLGGTIGGDAFGGGLGDANTAAIVGNTKVNLNGLNAAADIDNTIFASLTGENKPLELITGSTKYQIKDTEKGAIVSRVFGANNTNGSPQGKVEVYVFKTQNTAADHIAKETSDKVLTRYDVSAVFGGGKQAAYTATGQKAKVFIETCKASINEVYGGGYGASSNATYVDVEGSYEIGTVFGGGYGAGSDDPTAADYNPGADVETTAEVILKGGVIHEVYGGSNTKGDVKGCASVIVNEDGTGCCDLAVDNVYGAGKNASMSGDVNIVMGCQPNKLIEEIYAGSKRADVDGNVSLTITSGKFGRVFGGNKYSGALKGSITVNIEETGTCDVPIIIGELYAGGNLADYSIYGYDSDGKAIESGGTPLYNDPKLNIRSFTSIGKVFGGGYKALMVANPTVNINVAKGSKNGSGLTAGSFNFDVKADDGTVEEAGLSLAYPAHAAGEIGAIGDVYGGGNLAKIIGSATVNIGTETTVGFVTEPIHLRENPEVAISKTNGLYVVPAEGATIIGDVFGGGNLADITGDTHVNICAKEVTNSDNTTSWQKVTYGTGLAGVSIDKKTDGKGGSVFGGGSRADVLGNTYVRMSGGYVFNGVFGGGYAGNVGTFDVRDKTLTVYNFDHSTRNELHSDCIGKPTHCVDGTGKCTVVVDGGQIGPIEVATQGMTRTKDGKYDPVPQGWVWGGGQGLIEDPAVEKDTHFKSYVGSTDVTIGGDAFILESVIGGGEFGRVLYDTKVTITGDCQIGVGEDQKETVNGVLKPKRYDPDDFIDPAAGVTSEQALTACSHFPYGKEISGKIEYLPYDPYYDEYCENPTFAANHLDLSPASTKNASDGKTWIGCVFAGGSGYMPYRKKDGSGYDWCSSAGLVERNAELYIEGGHILTNVYGGNEYTNVKGTCTVKMTGGTIGVPRTLEQIQAHPVICNLFGAGKGDQRKHFNKETNVGDVEVIVEGGIIYGSVFGGGEDGHVLRDVKVTIGKDDDHTGPKIGTWGTSYMDGNVFGGGRGFGGDAYTAGNVAGSVDLKIKGGTILGSVYGGGRLGSVGYGLYDATADGYGEMRDDNKDDAGTTTTYYKDGLNKLGRGHVDITISGGTIGNTHEYIIPSASNTPSSLNINIDDIASWTDDNWKTWKTYNNIPLTEFDKETYRLKHTKSGNVFTGGMGRRFKLDGVTEIDETTDGIDWKKLGNVKSTKLTISGNAQIKIMGNVYGGGELGAVTGNHQLLNGTTPVTDTNGDPVVAGTEINIDGSNCVIGTEVGTGSDKYYFGSVYGGGMGEIYEEGTGSSATTVLAGGNVNDSTKVSMSNGSVRGSVYGGGELGQVFGSADVAVSGGFIGVSGFGGAEYGNIYGGGKGSTEKLDAGLIKTNTWVTVSGSPQIWHNIYGGGAYGSVGTITRGSDATYIHVPGQTSVPDMPKSWAENTGSALVRILGGTVGRNGNENGMVFGSSRGDLGAPGEIHDKLAWVKKAKVVIGATGTTGPNIKGSVYGSGENGHLFQDAFVEIHSGVVGIAEGEAIGSYTAGGASYPYRGNVYGGGCGTDKYDNNTKYNPLAGIVLGDASVTMDGGTVVHNIYGAGAMGSVGTMTTDANNHLVISSGGTTTIAISGGTVGVSGTVGVGNVFGAARGDSLYTEKGVAQVRSTSVTISQADGKTTMIYGNVYGGGETGDVGTYTNTYTSTGSKNYVWDKIDSKEIGGCSVSVTGGQIKGNVFGAGKGVANSFECEKAIVRTATVSVSAGTVNGNVYGGGEIGRVDQNTKVTIGDETATSGTSSPVIAGDVFGAGAGKETHGYSALVRGDAEVIIQGNAAVGKSVYGGGEIAAVGRYGLDSDNMPTTLVSGGECKVTVKGSAKIGTVSGGNVFGAGKGVNPFDDDHTYIDFTSNSESKWPKRMTIKPGAGQTLPVHYTEINGTDYIWEYYTSKEDYFKYLQTLALATDTKVSIEGSATVNGSVYGGSESGFVQRDTEIKIQGGEIGSADTNGTITTEGNVYGGGKGLSGFDNAGRVSGGVTIAVSDGQTHGDVYGGGELGVVKGAVLVNILGGTIDEDVYGGGALANTNTNNWDGTTLSVTYQEVSGLTVGTSSVVGYYTKSGDTYSEVTSGTAAANTTYYRKVNTTVSLFGGTLRDAYGGALGDANHKPSVYGDALVELNKGVADDAKGAIVNRIFAANNASGTPKGNVTVHVYATQNKDAQKVSDKLFYYYEDDNSTNIDNVNDVGILIGYLADLIRKAQKLGITVTDYQDYDNNSEVEEVKAAIAGLSGKINNKIADTNTPADKIRDLYNMMYDVRAVYGGGNEAAYVPETPWDGTSGSKSQVIIEGCEVTSIETVYGGGNAASVPETNVNVKSAWEVNQLFGGGNGKDATSYGQNPGADVGIYKNASNENVRYGTGDANSNAEGGYIHELYGASNSKGDIKGTINIQTEQKGSCILRIDKVYNAGKNADVEGDKYIVLSCQPTTKIKEYYCGAENANVKGKVEVTITNGKFGKVFGGNNQSGAIFGHIKLNIEETGCNPITIDELYGCGNDAAYSVYGYYVKTKTNVVDRKKILKGDPDDNEETAVTTSEGRLIFLPRESANDVHWPVKNYWYDETDAKWKWSVYKGTNEEDTFEAYDDPEINIISATSIGKVFGGGYGVNGDVYGNPKVNINMIPGDYASRITATDENPNQLGEIGTVYGGGNEADVIGVTTVSVGTLDNVRLHKSVTTSGVYTMSEAEYDVKGAYITANVYGGGKGKADSFTCEKAMVMGNETTKDGTKVTIGKGMVKGSVYGGGEIGRVEWNTDVTIGLESGISAPVVKGNVFGAGKGDNTHGYAALVRGNSTVVVQNDAKIGLSVYGGGEIASVGKYNVAQTEAEAAEHGVEKGMPYSLVSDNRGICSVTVKGNAEIGPDNMKMYHTDKTAAEDKPDDAGHVFGGGRGILPYVDMDPRGPGRIGPDGEWESYEGTAKEADYLRFIKTLALVTQTTTNIEGNAFVKGSVYGGSENGLVQHDTKVYIKGGQIGCGKNTTRRHVDDYPTVWDDNFILPDGVDLECASWDYKLPYAPYDPFADTAEGHEDEYPLSTGQTERKSTEGGRKIASDGHTYYGNVFGGGSGSIPYLHKGVSTYNSSAGTVEGSTYVEITGGHILTNVYGGCEATNVLGKATVKMTGGTLGVPRTINQIKNHPVTCYLFGAGKGDQRIFFNKETNVNDTEVEVDGARIYGSVFGGGEDGHVLRNSMVTIKQTGDKKTKIGTWGTTYVDGNVFGGGRGFGGDALTAGNVGGAVDVKIQGGEMLGSIYGGGRLASVGYGLYLVDDVVDGEKPYGTMRPDDKYDDSYPNPSSEDASVFFNKGRGHVKIEITGGTIGNDLEYIVPESGNIPNTISTTDISQWTTTAGGDWDKWKEHNKIPNTEFDTSTGRLTHTKGGNVFAGSMGRFYALDNTTVIPHWVKLGNVKSTNVTISGANTKIKSCVYGGGELGWVSGTQTKTGRPFGTEITIISGTIGTEVKKKVDGADVTQYTFGSVFGGGYGSAVEELEHTENGQTVKTYPKFVAGRVKCSTKVDMQDGAVKASIYGGGEVASIGMGSSFGEDVSNAANVSTNVSVSGGTVGIDKVGSGEDARYFGGPTMGNVYGGGSGTRTIVRCGMVFGNSNVNISEADGKTTRIYHNVYGGGAYGTVGDFEYEQRPDPDYNNVIKAFGIEKLHTDGTGTATVTVTGGIIGIDGKSNGMVFGSSRGDVQGNFPRDDYAAWVNKAYVNIGTDGSQTGPSIRGSVYGSGENGHTFDATYVNILSGTVGVDNDVESGMPVVCDGVTYTGAEYSSRGNVYGGGCGTDTYEETVSGQTKTYYNPMAGIVYGNTDVNIKGGHVVRSVYGGGSMGSVGTYTNNDAGKPTSCKDETGLCKVTVSGGKIGPKTMRMPNTYGNVFGAGRGEMHDPAVYANLETSGYFNKTEVTISDNAFVKGSVYGGSESGHVLGDTKVTVSGGQIGCGDGLDVPYDDWSSTSLKACNSWAYTENGLAYDKYADVAGYNSEGGATIATDGHTFYGNVFGGGSGYEPYAAGKWLETAGRVEGKTEVEITGGHILSNVYGGNECTDVLGTCKVTMTGGTVGVPYPATGFNPVLGHLFGAGKGDKRIFFNTWTNVKQATVSVSGGRVFGSVYGGGEDGHVGFEGDTGGYDGDAATTISGIAHIGTNGNSGYDGNVFGGGQGSPTALTAGVVQGNVTLNIEGGQIDGSVYGGGRLASVGTHLVPVNSPVYGELQNDDNHGNIKINLTGGTINQDVFGGCMGSTMSVSYPNEKSNADMGISRDVTVELNKSIAANTDGCVVNGSIFGCNNANGTPKGHSTVHIFRTAGSTKDPTVPVSNRTSYDVAAVYGGGKSADYVPASTDTKQSTEVIIEGCDLTSIKEVYGGGYGAATPGTNVLIKGTYIIDNVYGGGYGASTGSFTNPGANVGIRTNNTNYEHGEGKAIVQLMAGTVNHVYGGSNSQGNIRGASNVMSVVRGPGDTTPSCCTELNVLEIYGGGKNADMYGGAEIVLGCMPDDWIGAIYAGAENSDIGHDVSLTLTSGKFGRVFGGNRSGGKIGGYIEVNLEENPDCGTPLIIGEVYGGGDEAPYSIYGYKMNEATGKWEALGPGNTPSSYQSPRINVRSFTSIGNIFGGGYGSTATVAGNPMVNINEVIMTKSDGSPAANGYDPADDTGKPSLIDGTKVKLWKHEAGKMGVINNVFGGGNEADVIGTTYVNIGTTTEEEMESLKDMSDINNVIVVKKPVVGADIRGNVYGGGNNAGVTGNTNVVIGKEKVTTP